MGFPPTLFGTPREKGGHAARRFPKPTPAKEWWPITTDSVLLALDPSIANCGYAVLLKTSGDPIRLESGIIHPRGDDERSRYDDLAAQICKRAQPKSFNGEMLTVTDAVVEIPSGGQRPNVSAYQLMTYARAVGVCESASYFAGLSVNRVPVNAWKGREKKSRTLAIVRAIFKYDARDDNEGDALGLGLWLCAKR